MTERLPGAIYDKLATSIWQLGRISMAHIVDIAPVPARIKGELTLDDEVLEPEFLLTNPATFYTELPAVVGLTVNSWEAYVREAEFTMYTWRKILLNTRRRSREFTRGVTLLDGQGNSIEPQLELPELGKRKRQGTQSWRELSTNSNLQAFDAQTAQDFIDTSNRFREHIKHNNS